MPIRSRLGALCSQIQQEMVSVSRKIISLTSQDSFLDRGEQLLDAQTELDSLCIELQHTLMFVAILQDKGTFSVAEGQATLLQKGGQIYTGVLKQRANSFSGLMQGKPEAVAQYHRKLSVPLVKTVDKSYELLRRLVGERACQSLLLKSRRALPFL